MIIKSLENLNSISIKIADNISNSDCILLIGEIGVGKTTFTRSFINYLQKKENLKPTAVLSPTFNLLYEYEISNLKVMHYDLYRLKNSEEVKQLNIFDNNENAIKIIEWPDLIKDNADDRLELNFNYLKKENERDLKLQGYGKWKNFKINEF